LVAFRSLRVGRGAQPHAGRVDDKARCQLSPTGDGGIADGDGANRAALGLDRRTTGTGDGPRNAAAQLKVVVGRVDDGVDVLLRQVALQDLDGQAPGPPAHPLVFDGSQAIDAIRASTSSRVIGCRPLTLKCWMVKDAITIA